MTRPLFSVGEEVILQSKDFPQLNGDYVVCKVLQGVCQTICHIRNHNVHLVSDGLSYVLEGLGYPDGYYFPKGREMYWKQHALRKKHKPAGLNFKECVSGILSKTKHLTVES